MIRTPKHLQPLIVLPKAWVPCPWCGKHLVIKHREKRRYCRWVEEQDARPSHVGP